MRPRRFEQSHRDHLDKHKRECEKTAQRGSHSFVCGGELNRDHSGGLL
jgi:hypothetical protein